MNFPDALDSEALLRESSRLRALIRSLVRDEHLAEDSVQTAIERSLQRSFESLAHWRGWLSTTAHNAALEARRASATRAARERVAAASELVAAADAEAERIDGHRSVLDALEQLDPKLRSTLVQIYLEERELDDIARAQGISVDGVRKRAARGLAAMREELEKRHGSRQGMLALLIPLATPPRNGLGAARTTWANAFLASAAVATIALLVASLGPWQRATPLEASVAARPFDDNSSRTSDNRGEPELRGERSAVVRTERIEVRVVDSSSGDPVPGAALRWWPLPSEPGAAERAEEWFERSELERRTSAGALELEADEVGAAHLERGENGFLVTAKAGESWGYAVVERGAIGPVRVEVRWDADLEVVVLDLEGAPVPGAVVGLIPLNSDGEHYVDHPTGADGRVVLRHAGYIRSSRDDPARANAVLQTWVGGRSWTKHLELDELGREVHEFRLDKPVGWLDVRIVDPLTMALVPGETWYVMSTHCCLAIDGISCIPTCLDYAIGLERFSLPALHDEEEFAPLNEPGERVTVTLAARSPQAPTDCGSVAGTLVSADRTPIRAQQLALRPTGEDAPVAWTRTDGSGRFEFARGCEWDESNTYEVFLTDDFGSLVAACGRAFQLNSGPQTQLGQLAAPRVPPSIRGRVIDRNGGGAIASAKVTLLGTDAFKTNALAYLGYADHLTTTTQLDGSFAIAADHKSDGTPYDYTLVVKHPGYANMAQRVRTGSADVVAELDSIRSIRGRVRVDSSIATTDLWVESAAFEDELGADMDAQWSSYAPTRERRRVELSGEFELAGVGASRTFVRVLYYGPECFSSLTGTALYSTSLTLGPRERARELPEIDLRGKFRRCRFEVSDSMGRPTPRETIRVESQDYSALLETDSFGVAVLLVPHGARARLDSGNYFDEVIDSPGTIVTIRVEARPELEFSLIGGRPALDDGLALTLRVESLQSDEAFWADIDASGSARCSAAHRGPCRVSQYIENRRGSEPCKSDVVDGYAGRDQIHMLTPPSAEEISAATARLRARLDNK